MLRWLGPILIYLRGRYNYCYSDTASVSTHKYRFNMSTDNNVPLRSAAIFPPRTTIEGQHVRLQPLGPDAAESLFKNVADSAHDKFWTYMPEGPFADRAQFNDFIVRKAKSDDPIFFAVVRISDQEVVGMLSLMRIDLNHATIEIGWILYSPLVQRSPITTECTYLLLKLVFEKLQYRRCEWKCDNLNGPSRRAAERFGFTFEGVFRQHMIIKGRNRDTAWFAIMDSEWPGIKRAFELWLRPENFDNNGRQLTRLEDLRRP